MTSTPRDGLPGTPAGPELGVRLAALDPHDAPDDALLDLLRAETRQLAHQQARQWAVLAEIARRDPLPNLPPGTRWGRDEIFDSAVHEVRAELLLTRRSARRELENAIGVAALPRVAAALAAGELDRTRALVLADGCLDLTAEQAATLLAELLPAAGTVTATRLAEKVRRVAVALDPAWAERRYRAAVRDRRLIGYLNSDGSATVSGQNLPADEAAAACDRVDALAAAAQRAGAAGPIDHLRTELFLGLLDGRFLGMTEQAIVAEVVTRFPKSDPIEPGAARRGVHLKVGLDTLLGRNDEPGEIAGWGAVPASVARRIATRQRRVQWRFAVVDAVGQVLFDGITRRRPRSGGEASGSGDRRLCGGIVELHVALDVLDDATVRAAHPEWSAVLVDLATQYQRQTPIEQDPAARFPGRPLRRRIQIRVQRCVFPGCRRPADDCDLDHHREHGRGGRTEAPNLGPGCRRHHLLKTNRGWRLIRRDERTYVWISPLGRRHVVRIEPVAAPLPAPNPRPRPPEYDPADHLLSDRGPSFAARDRRGRPLPTAAIRRATETDPDPPPF